MMILSSVVNVPKAEAAAGTNQQINYQGRLLTIGGAVVPDGTYNMEFKIYQDGPGNVAGDTGGTLKWTEDWVYGVNTPDNRVTVRNGYFSVALGSICTFSSTTCTASTGNSQTNAIIDWNQDTLWMSVNIGNLTTAATFAGASGDGEMLPMRRMSSAIYALNANKVGGLTASQLVQLSPAGQQTGSINISSTLTAGGAINGLTLTVNSLAAATAATNLAVDAGTTGQVQVGGVSTGDILLGGGSASTGCTVTNTTGAFACSSTINGLTMSATNLAVATAATGLTIDAGTTGTIAIGGFSTGNILLGGGSGSTGCTITNSTGDFACTGSLTGSSLVVSGTTTSSQAITLNANTIQSTVNTSQYSIQNQPRFDLTSVSGATLNNVYGLINIPDIYNNPGGKAVTNAYGEYVRVDNTSAAAITNAHLLHVSDGGTTNIVNKYGVYVDNITGGSSLNYPLYLDATGGTANDGVALMSVNNIGQTIHKTSTDSATAFQIQASGSTNAILNYDTIGQQLSVRNKTDAATLAADIAAPATGTGTNWTGTGPYTHTTGSVAPLTFSSPAILANTTYEITYTTTGTTAGEYFIPTIGGVAWGAIYGNVTGETQVITTTGTGSLLFTPTSNATGTITLVSLKIITNSISSLVVKDSSGAIKLEVRANGYNTALGLASLQSNTTGFGNTASGTHSLQSNTTGSYNTASGVNSLQSNTTGSYNSAFGASSLIFNTTGDANTASGYSSLLYNTTGAANTATGYYSLRNNTTGNFNTASGWWNLISNTTGSYNTGSGYASLKNNTTGNNNTATGNYSLYYNTTGSNNIGLGSYAGAYETGGGALYVDAFDRTNTAGDKAGAILYGQMNATPANQALTINATTTVANTALFKNLSDSATAFQIQGAGSANALLNYDTTNQQLSVRNKTDVATLGSDIAAPASGTGTNWTGTNPYTHTTGSTAALTFSSPAITANTTYEITYTTAGTTAGESFTPWIGGANGVVGVPIYGDVTAKTRVITTIGTDSLLFVPTSGATGTITLVSLKIITNSTNALAVKNSSGVTSLEVRADAASANTGLGLYSLQSNISGIWSTAIGYGSLESNTTGSWNTAVGMSALASNTTGYANTAVGVNNLRSNTTGIYNTAVGENTLARNTTGSFNVATGPFSLLINSTGNYNNSSGAFSMYNNTTGSNNTASGSWSLRNNTMGDNNTASGYLSLQNNITGIGNTASGYRSGMLNTTGSYNTSFGNQSLLTNTTGSNNIGLGNYAGAYETGGGALYVDAFDRTNTAGDKAGAILYGQMNATPASQTLTINAATTVANTALFKNLTDSPTAFQIQNASGSASILNVDTSNSVVTIRGNKDTPTIGSDIVTSQDFSNPTYWACSTGWTATTTTAQHNTGNTNTCDSTATNFTVTPGTKYLVTYTVSGSTGGDSVQVMIGNNLGSYTGGNGTFNVGLTATNSDPLKFIPESAWNGTISNVVVKIVSNDYSNPQLAVKDQAGTTKLELRVSGTNLGFGLSSLRANTTGNYNTASGTYSLQNNTTGNDNTASGYASLQNNTTGYSNIASGSYSLNSNTTGYSNTANGTSSLKNNTTGNSNTATGYASLYYNTTGMQNTATGIYAGYQDNMQTQFKTLSTIDNSTTLGAFSQAYANNVLALGGQSSNAVKVGIGTGLPTNQLSAESYRTSAGTLTTNGTTTITGSGTSFTSDMVGNLIYIATNSTTTAPYMRTITGYTSATQITVDSTVPTLTNAQYYINYAGLQVTTAGNVGIGTTTPSYKLHIKGSSNNTTSNSIVVENTLDDTMGGAVFNAKSATSSGYIGAFGSNFTSLPGYADRLVVATNSDASGLTVSTINAGQDVRWRNGSGEYMRFDSDGNVGIGTTNPTAKLEVISSYNAAVAAEQAAQIITTAYGVADTTYKQGLRLNTFANNTAGTLANLNGITALNIINGSGGTTLNSPALWARNDVSAGATLTNGYGLVVQDGYKNATGTFTNQYGLYVEPLGAADNNYAIYAAGSTKSYFGGNVGIGTTTIGTNNRLIVNAYSTVDNLATAQINTNAATNKGLVVQGYASQSALLTDWQSSNGSTVASVASNGIITSAAGLVSVGLYDTSSAGPYITMGSNSVSVTNRTTVGNIPLTVFGMAGQTGDLQRWNNSTPTVVASVSAAGLGTFAGVTSSTDINLLTGSALALSNSAGNSTAYLYNNGSTGFSLLETSADFKALGTITATGAITGVGVNSGTGLLQGTGGLTVTGAVANINANSNFATNINTGTSTGLVTIGNNSNAANTVTLAAGATNGINLNAPKIVTNAATLGLFTTPTTVNAFTAATALNEGAATGTTTFGNGGAYTLRSTTGQLTVQSGSGILSFGSTTSLTNNGVLAINSGGTGSLTLSTSSQAGASTNSAQVWINSGHAAGITSNSGNVNIDTGTATGTTGTILVGAANASGITLSKSGIITNVNGVLTVAEATNLNGNTTIGNATTDRLTVTSQLLGASPLVFQGLTDNGFATTLAVTDPTANRTITLPNETGTICTTGSVCTGYAPGATNGYIQLAPAAVQADATTNASIFINKTGASGNILQLQKSGVDRLTLSNSGGLLLDNTATTNAFRVEDNASAVAVFKVDTSNRRVGIGIDAPSVGLHMSNNSFRIDGTSVDNDAMMTIQGTLANSLGSTTQYGLQNQTTFAPTVTPPSAIYALENTAIMSGTLSVAAVVGATSRVDTGAGYSGTITNGYGFNASAPVINGTNKITNYYNFQASMPSNGATSNSGNTSGTISNYGLRVTGNNAEAGVGGTLNNYGVNVRLPLGNTAGTTNYGLYLSGNGGASATNNYAIWSDSTAKSYLAGKLGIGTTNALTDISFGTDTNRVINVEAQDTAATAGSNLTVNSAQGNTSGAGGLLTVQAGAGGTTGIGGAVTIQGGNGGSTSGAGGAVSLIGGNATAGVTNGGDVTISGGAKSSTGVGGSVIIKPQADNDSATAFQVQNSTGTPMETIDTTSGIIIIGSATTDATQINLQLDSFSTQADTGTCNATTNQGALYYNTNTTSIRTCENSLWADVATNKDLGLITFGIIPDSVATTGTGDLSSANGYNSGPCKTYVTGTANIIGWNSCVAYSNGRKYNIASGTATVSASTSVFQNLCINTSGVAALVGTANATETTAGLFPTFSVAAPILCLATIKTATVSNKVAAIYDTRVYTTTAKTFATVATTLGLGAMVKNNGTIGQFAPTTATTEQIAGVVVAYSGSTSTTTPNAIIATAGPVAVKATAGTIAQIIDWGAAVGYATTLAAATTATNPYVYAGVAQNSYSGVAAGCTISTVCNGSLFTNLNIR